MFKHGKSMVLGVAALGLAVAASPVGAQQNIFTINETTGAQGLTGGAGKFIPFFLSSANYGDPNAIGENATSADIYIPYIGTLAGGACAEPINSQGTTLGCAAWGAASLTAWASGMYYDPRFGTPFIPPSGDHHRTGYRLLMQPSFSGGQWLSGFAPLAERFPFFPQVGTSGPGGDVGLAMADASFKGGLNGILEMADAHGEPLTTGKFPRYWPHERAAWVDTLMVKYTAGGGVTSTAFSGADESAFNQSIRSSMSFARNATVVRWRAMSNLDGHFSLDQDSNTATQNNSDGCPGGWCEFYILDPGNDGVDLQLYVVKGADGDTTTIETTGNLEITQVTKLDTINALGNNGYLLVTKTLSDLEKLPSLVDDRLAQYVGGEAPSTGAGSRLNSPTVFSEQAENSGFEQQIIQQFRVYSGPNVHSEEGADPYAWVICGTRGHEYGEDMCGDVTEDGAIDAETTLDPNGVVMALVYKGDTSLSAEDAITRMGADLNPARVGGNDVGQDTGAYVACSDTATGTVMVSGVVYNWNTCESEAGADGFYGTPDDGTVYYKEATENGLRGWIRETNGHAFSFLGAAVNGVADFGLTSLMVQRDDDPDNSNYLMSCLNCSPHNAPAITDLTVSYDLTGTSWLPNFNRVLHPPTGTGELLVLP